MFAPRDKSQKMHLWNWNLPRVNLCHRFFHFFSSKEIFSNFNASLFCRAPHHENSLNHWWDCLPWTRRGAIYAFQSRWSWMSPNNKVQFALEKLKWKHRERIFRCRKMTVLKRHFTHKRFSSRSAQHTKRFRWISCNFGKVQFLMRWDSWKKGCFSWTILPDGFYPFFKRAAIRFYNPMCTWFIIHFWGSF